MFRLTLVVSIALFPLVALGQEKVPANARELLDTIREARSDFPPHRWTIELEANFQCESQPFRNELFRMESEVRVRGPLWEQIGWSENYEGEDASTLRHRQLHRRGWDGERHWNNQIVDGGKSAGPDEKLKGRSFGSLSTDATLYGQPHSNFSGMALYGYLRGDDQPYYQVLADASEVKLRKRTEAIDGVECLVIESKNERGHYQIWIDPAHGYHIRKARVERKADDIGWRGERISEYEWRPMSHIVYELSDVKIEKAGERYVPVEGVAIIEQTYTDGTPPTKTRRSIRLSNIEFNPDFEALDAFRMRFPEGTRVVDFDTSNTPNYVWSNGQLEPFEFEPRPASDNTRERPIKTPLIN